MGPARVLILGVAFTAAIGAALIVRGMAKGQPAPVAVAAPAAASAPSVERPMTEVLIAKRDLPQGTVIVEQDMAWQAWPQDSLNELFITKASAPKRDDDSAVVKAVEKAATATKEAIAGPESAVAALIGTVVRDPSSRESR